MKTNRTDRLKTSMGLKAFMKVAKESMSFIIMVVK